MEGNVVEFIPGVTSETDCKSHCQANFQCAYYTYYAQQSLQFSNICVLLTEIRPPHVKCQSCVTSVRDCKNQSDFCRIINEAKEPAGLYLNS